MIISLSLGYSCYLVHQLFSDRNLYKDDGPDSGKQKTVENTRNLSRKLHNPHRKPGPASTPPPSDDDATDPDNPPRDMRSVEAGPTVYQEEQPRMSAPMTIGLLVIATVVCR